MQRAVRPDHPPRPDTSLRSSRPKDGYSRCAPVATGSSHRLHEPAPSAPAIPTSSFEPQSRSGPTSRLHWPQSQPPGYSACQPDPRIVNVIATPAGLRIPPALGDYRVIRRAAKLDPEVRNGLPVWGAATLLVAMSHRPASYRDWPNVADWLDQAVSEVSDEELRVELTDEPRSTWMRLAYLLDRGGRSDLANDLAVLAPEGQGPYYLGPRDRRGRHHGGFDVIDSALEEFAP